MLNSSMRRSASAAAPALRASSSSLACAAAAAFRLFVLLAEAAPIPAVATPPINPITAAVTRGISLLCSFRVV